MNVSFRIIFISSLILLLLIFHSAANAQVYGNSSVRGFGNFRGYAGRGSSTLSNFSQYSTSIDDTASGVRRTDNPLAVSRSARIPGMPTISQSGLASGGPVRQTNRMQQGNVTRNISNISQINRIAPVGRTMGLSQNIQPIRPIYSRYNRTNQFAVRAKNLGTVSALNQTGSTNALHSRSGLKQTSLGNYQRGLANKDIFTNVGLARAKSKITQALTLSGKQTGSQRNTNASRNRKSQSVFGNSRASLMGLPTR